MLLLPSHRQAHDQALVMSQEVTLIVVLEKCPSMSKSMVTASLHSHWQARNNGSYLETIGE